MLVETYFDEFHRLSKAEVVIYGSIFPRGKSTHIYRLKNTEQNSKNKEYLSHTNTIVIKIFHITSFI